jgi:TonB family protein
MRSRFVLLLSLPMVSASAQESFAEYQVLPKGGRVQFEQVLETQLTLPQILLTKDFSAEVKTNFSIDSLGCATDIITEGTNNNALKKEIRRIMSFYRFQRTGVTLSRAQPYYVVFSLSTTRYRHYLKQRSNTKTRETIASDSSMSVYSRADRSPTYYKNDEEGLAEYILSEISYPAAAREKSVQGTVVVDFIVETNGFVTGIEPRTTVGAGCTDEAVRLIRETRWRPAVQGGKRVRYKMSYPITFSLNQQSRDLLPASTVGN